MPKPETIERFVARVEQNAHAEEELACQRWAGERIAQEQFFYDPAQRVPKRPTG